MHAISKLARIVTHAYTTYSASNAVIEWLLVVKMLETEIHLFRYSLFRVLQTPVTNGIDMLDL